MKPAKTEKLHVTTWQQEMARAVTDPRDLLRRLGLPESTISLDAADEFSVRVTDSYIARMKPGDLQDPLLLQVLPHRNEKLISSGYLLDPVGDAASMVVPGVIHKYHGRVLLITSKACALHCRYCFRRHFPYSESNPQAGDWAEAINYITANTSITEVILSGGDPLSLADSRLSALVNMLDAIPHLQRLRLHTRLPVALPSRVNDSLLRCLAKLRLPVVMVIHANHPNELSAEVCHALKDVTEAGVTLLNQSVLLKEVNDQVETLCNLSEALFAARVLPYYLHLLDKVQGAAHFDISEARARSLHKKLRDRLPGYLVPRLVRECEGDLAKQNKENQS